MARGLRAGERLGSHPHGPNEPGHEEEKKRIRDLERELARKDRALAETAALLVLRKKAAAIWGGGDEDA